MDYAKGYLALAAYILTTKAIGLNFWQLGYGARPFWLVGAVIVLVVAVFWSAAPERRRDRY